VMNYMFHIAET